MKSLQLLTTAFSIALIGTSSVNCGLGTDAATRLANDMVDNAARLQQDGQELTFTHVPRSWPEGCSSGYTVELQDSLRGPGRGGSLLVGCNGESRFREFGYSYATTSHLNAVRVPVALRAEKQAGEALQVTVAKHGAAVDVVAVK